MFGAEISEWVSTIKKAKPASKHSAIGDRCNRSIYQPAHLSGSGLNDNKLHLYDYSIIEHCVLDCPYTSLDDHLSEI